MELFLHKAREKDMQESHPEYFLWQLFCIETFPLDSLPNVLLVTKKGSTRSKFFWSTKNYLWHICPHIRSCEVTRLVTNIVQSGEPSRRGSASANVAWTEALKSIFFLKFFSLQSIKCPQEKTLPICRHTRVEFRTDFTSLQTSDIIVLLHFMSW